MAFLGMEGEGRGAWLGEGEDVREEEEEPGGGA